MLFKKKKEFKKNFSPESQLGLTVRLSSLCNGFLSASSCCRLGLTSQTHCTGLEMFSNGILRSDGNILTHCWTFSPNMICMFFFTNWHQVSVNRYWSKAQTELTVLNGKNVLWSEFWLVNDQIIITDGCVELRTETLNSFIHSSAWGLVLLSTFLCVATDFRSQLNAALEPWTDSLQFAFDLITLMILLLVFSQRVCCSNKSDTRGRSCFTECWGKQQPKCEWRVYGPPTLTSSSAFLVLKARALSLVKIHSSVTLPFDLKLMNFLLWFLPFLLSPHQCHYSLSWCFFVVIFHTACPLWAPLLCSATHTIPPRAVRHQSWRDIVTRLIKTELCALNCESLPRLSMNSIRQYQSQQPGAGGEGETHAH